MEKEWVKNNDGNILFVTCMLLSYSMIFSKIGFEKIYFVETSCEYGTF